MDYLRSDSADRGTAYEMDPKVAAEVEAELAEMDSPGSAADAEETAASADPTAPKRSQSMACLSEAAVSAVVSGLNGKAGSEFGPGADTKAETDTKADAGADPAFSGRGAAAAAVVSGDPQPATSKEDFWRFM